MWRRSEIGRTRLFTTVERHRLLAACCLAVIGAVACAWTAAAMLSWLSGTGFVFPRIGFRALTTGEGGLLGLPRPGQPTAPPLHAQFPVSLEWPASRGWTVVLAAPLWLLWLRYTVRPLLARLRQDTRHRGLAPLKVIRRRLGARAVRRAGRFTRPGMSWWRRAMLPAAEFGFCLGRPRDRRFRLWADWEQRIRVVARQGWGKTLRLLVPIVRALPGPAMVSSIEPGVFESTVTARRFRRPELRWWWLSLLARRWLPLREYPVAVVDFSAAEHRYAAGYPQVRFSPINGCEDFTVAYRRAVGLVSGAENTSTERRGEDNDLFFRQSAAEVLAAWLHAAALGGKDIDDLLTWLQKTNDPVPGRILRDDHRADPSAAVNLTKHLNRASSKTTSGVERYLALAMNSLVTADGRTLCGRRGDDQFDMAGFIAAGGTLYLLAEESRIDRARPLLSMFAAEMFLAAEKVALGSPGRKLPVPFIGVLDELRYAIAVPNLPYVSAAQRKYNIGFVYAVQSSTQEDAVFGKDAAALRAGAGVSIYGGIDIDSARELSERAGTTPVVTAARGREARSEYIQFQDTLTVGDQQQLRDGEATFVVRGMAPFLAWVPSVYEQRSLHRRISTESAEVARQVAGAREHDLALVGSRSAAAAAGTDFGQDEVH